MFDALRRNIVFIALALLGWFCYSDLSDTGPAKKAEAKTEIGVITAEMLAEHDANKTAPPLGDPFQFGKLLDGSATKPVAGGSAAGTPARSMPASVTATHANSTAAGGKTAPSAGAAVAGAPGAAAPAGSPGQLNAAADRLGSIKNDWWLQQTVAWMEQHPEWSAPAAAPAVHVPAHFTLALEATLDEPTGGQARLSGRSVAVGETLPWLDPIDPPKLESVDGTTAIVSYGAERYVLDLNGPVSVEVGSPVVAVAAPAGAPRAQAAPTQVSAAPAPAAGAGAIAAPTATGEGGKSKGGYRVRSLPGKLHP